MQRRSTSVTSALIGLALAVSVSAQTTFSALSIDDFSQDRVLSAAAGDVDGDGQTELVVVSTETATLTVLGEISDSGWLVEAEVGLPGSPRPYAYFSPWIGDADGDGDTEVLLYRRANNRPGLLVEVSSGSSGYAVSSVPTPETDAGYRMAVGDLNGDGLPDIVTSDLGFGSAAAVHVLWNGVGPDRFSTSVRLPALAGSYVSKVYLSDVDGDGSLDILTGNHNRGASTISVFSNDGGTFLGPVGLPSDDQTRATEIATADLDGDGALDLVSSALFGGAPSSRFKIHRGDGFGGFLPPETVFGGFDPRAPVIGDFDLDGLTDVAVDNAGDRNVEVFFTSSWAQPWSKQSVVLTDSALSSSQHFSGGQTDPLLIGADIDDDGDLDLVHAGSNLVVLLNGLDPCAYAPAEAFSDERRKGKPVWVSWQFESCGGPGVAIIETSLQTSALIELNGVLVATPNDFKRRDDGFEIAIDLVEGINEVRVQSRGKKGSQLSIRFEADT